MRYARCSYAAVLEWREKKGDFCCTIMCTRLSVQSGWEMRVNEEGKPVTP